MSGNTFVNYAIAIVVGVVVAVVTAGTGLAVYASLIGGIAFSATAAALNYYGRPGMTGLSGPKGLGNNQSNSVKDAAAGQLEMASASEAVAVPVVFGKVRIAGNFIRWDKSTFFSEPIIQEYKVQNPVIVTGGTSGGGGKGGGGGGGSSSGSGSQSNEDGYTIQRQIVGYKYYLSWEYGLCTGPVDSIGKIYSSPGEKSVGTGIAFVSDRQTRALSGADEGGNVIIYQGTDTQTRPVGDIYHSADGNYRGLCFASFQRFYMGQQPAPKTYLFEVTRYPRCVDANGDTITAMKVRGSNDNTNASYLDANPAAILYEIFTNNIWGRGLSPDLIDVDSFVAASQYFAGQNIGLSFTIESLEVVQEVIDQVRSHVNTVVVWVGDKLKCLCMMDRSTAYEQPVKLTSEMVSDVSFSRPAWPEQVNELRLQFVNRTNNYQQEIVLMQDLASINTIGSVNSMKLAMLGFSSRAIAEAQAARMLAELSYPRATVNLKMNRWHSKMEPGQLIEFVWREWTGASEVTGFYRLAEINDDAQDSAGIGITMTEDLYLTSYAGSGQPIVPSVPPFEDDIPNDDADLNQGDDASAPLVIGNLAIVAVWEQPPFLSGGNDNLIFTSSRPNGFITAVVHYWSLTASINYATHSATSGWAITGTLNSALLATQRTLFRETADGFTLVLTNDAEGASMLASANKVVLDADDMAVLLSGSDLLLIGNEIIMVGHIEELTPGVYTCTNFIRGAFGSTVQAHSIGAPFAFISQWDRALYQTVRGPIPLGVGVSLRTHAITPQGEDTTNYDYVGPEAGGTFVGRGAAPYLPELIQSSVVGLAWTVYLRGRFADRGAGIEGDFQKDVNTLVTALPEGYSIMVQPYNGGTALGDPVAAPMTFIPCDGVTYLSGCLLINYTAPATTDRLRFWANKAGRLSLDYLPVGP